MSQNFKIAVLAAAFAAATAANVHERVFYEKAFFEHMSKFEIQIKDGADFVKRLEAFSDNFDLIEAHNKSNSTYSMALNQFSHLTLAEFAEVMHLNPMNVPNLRNNAQVHTAPADARTLPDSIDWSEKGAVSAVKDQGSCGSCWAFSTVGALEGAHFLKTSNLIEFSEQHLVSCDKVDGGCNGGWMDTAFQWVTDNKGLATRATYPYSSGNGQTGTCKTSGYTVNTDVIPTSFVDVKTKDVLALQSAVAQQPVSIAIQANQAAFQSYSGGVLTGRCGNRLDHGVLATGYGTLNGVDYWKVKNSWGPKWGIDGYILIERSSADLCGVLDAASYPVL